MKKAISLMLMIIISVSSITFAAADSTELTGDLNSDGTINIKDATLLQKHLADIITLDNKILSHADVDSNGKITILDATIIQKYVAGIIKHFPVDKEETPTTEPTTVATEPTTDATEPITDATEPTTDTTEPTTTPTTEPAEPTTVVTEPTTVVTEQTTDTTEPTTEPTVAPTEPTSNSPDTPSTSKTEAEILSLVNKERAKSGVAPLEFGDFFYDAVKVRAKEVDMKFSHTRPDGRSCFSVFDDFGIDSNRYLGENIAYGYGSAESVMKGWMNSPGHRENILNPNYDYIAIGVYERESSPGDYSFVQLFASDLPY